MGKFMVYKPIDVLLELMRTMLFEYLNAKIGKRKMQKVNKRLGRIAYVFNNLKHEQQQYIQKEFAHCYTLFQSLEQEMIKLTVETEKIEFTQMADILIKEQPQVKFSNLFDMLCQKYIENYNDIENLIKENINPGNLKYIRVDTVSGKKVLIQRQVLYPDNQQTQINYKREFAADLIKRLPIDMRQHYYELCLNITNIIVKGVSQPVIFAGGTGQLYSLLKNNFKNTQEFFAFGDIDLQIKLQADKPLKPLKEKLVGIFTKLIQNQYKNPITQLSFEHGDYKFEAIKVPFYRNMKISKDIITTFFRQNINPTTFLFDIIELYIESKEIPTALICRLFLHIKVTNMKQPNKFKFIQMELVDVSVHLNYASDVDDIEIHQQLKQCGDILGQSQQFQPGNINNIKDTIKQSIQ